MRHSPLRRDQPDGADAGYRPASGSPPVLRESASRAEERVGSIHRHELLFRPAAVAIHALLGGGLLMVLLFAIVIGGLPYHSVRIIAWGWSIVFGMHLGAAVTRRRLLGAHVGLFVPLSLGLLRADLLDSSLAWSPWIVGILGTGVLIHAGLNYAHHPPDVLCESPSPRATGAMAPSAYVVPAAVTSPAPARAEMSFSMKIASVGLGAFALISALAALWVGLSNPSGADHLRSSGTGNVRWTIPVETFDRIEVSGNAQVFVRSGAVPQVTASGQDAIVPHVEAQVTNGFLQISLPSEAQHAQSPEGPALVYEIVVPNLAELRLDDSTWALVEIVPQEKELFIATQGNASATIASLAVPRVSVVAREDSSVTLSGTAEDLAVTASGRARVQAQDLLAQQANVAVSEQAAAAVTATGLLTGQVTDEGMVHYDGHPTVAVQVSPDGTLAPLQGSDQSTPVPAGLDGDSRESEAG